MAAAIRVARAPKFRIERADDDARMIRTQTVKANEMPTVHGKHATSFYDRKFKDAFIRPALTRFARFENCQHVIAQRRSSSTTGSGKFSFEYSRATDYASSFAENLLVNFAPVQPHVGPCVRTFLGS